MSSIAKEHLDTLAQIIQDDFDLEGNCIHCSKTEDTSETYVTDANVSGVVVPTLICDSCGSALPLRL